MCPPPAETGLLGLFSFATAWADDATATGPWQCDGVPAQQGPEAPKVYYAAEWKLMRKRI